MRFFVLALLILLPAYSVVAQEQPSDRFSQFYAAAEKFDSGRMADCNRVGAEFYPVDWKVERVTELALNAMYLQENSPSNAERTPEELLEQLDKSADLAVAEYRKYHLSLLGYFQEQVSCAIRLSVLLQEHHPALEDSPTNLIPTLPSVSRLPYYPESVAPPAKTVFLPVPMPPWPDFTPLPSGFASRPLFDVSDSLRAGEREQETYRVRDLENRLADLETQQNRARFNEIMNPQPQPPPWTEHPEQYSPNAQPHQIYRNSSPYWPLNEPLGR